MWGTDLTATFTGESQAAVFIAVDPLLRYQASGDVYGSLAAFAIITSLAPNPSIPPDAPVRTHQSKEPFDVAAQRPRMAGLSAGWGLSTWLAAAPVSLAARRTPTIE